MSNGNNFRKPLPKTAFNEFKLRLVGEPVKGSQRPPNLAVSVVKNQPRLTVFTNVEGDENKGIVTAAMDTNSFAAMLTLLDDIALGEPGEKVSIENKNHTYVNNERSKEPVVVSNVIIGKDDEGCVFIGVMGKGVTPVKFIFGPTEYHHFLHKDGSAFSRAELSVLFARSWVDNTRKLLANVLDTHYMEPEPREDNRRGGGYNRGGGGNRRGGGGGNSGFDAGSDFGDITDDFPM